MGADELSATNLCQQMARLLVRMRTHATAEDNAEISEVLEAVSNLYSLEREEIDLEMSVSVGSEGSPFESPVAIPDQHISHDVPHDTFSALYRHNTCRTQRLASLHENLHANNSARTTGYIGMSSEVRWLQSIAAIRSQQAGSEVEPPLRSERYESFEIQASSLSYWTDSMEIRCINTSIDPHKLPPIGLAKKLVSCYLLNVHDSFPILTRTTFERQFHLYFTALQHGNPPRLSLKWQANLNLVFAIGAKYSLLRDVDQNIDRCHHIVFQARANVLFLSEIEQAGPVDVPQIQYFGLLAFYHLCIGQISR